MSFIDTFQEGCTGISLIIHAFGGELPEEKCCNKHDLDYDAGGDLAKKISVDARLARCIYNSHDSLVMAAMCSLGAWSLISFLPYSYYVWFRSPRLTNDNK